MPGAAARVGRLSALVALAIFLPAAAAAQDGTPDRNHLYDTFSLGADFSTVLNHSNARVDASTGQGTTLDFRSLLGLSGTSAQPALGLRWKPGRRTEFDASYQFINQTGQRTFSDSLIIGNDTLAGDLDLGTKLGSSNATLQFKYAFWAADRHVIGAAIGLGAIFFSLDFNGNASGTCAGPDCAAGGSGDFSISKSVTLPTGSVGAFGDWRLGDRWYVGGDARGIGGRVDRFKVSVFEGDAKGLYYFSNRWAAGLGWYYTNVTVNVSEKGNTSQPASFSGKVAYSYSSIRLGAVYAF